MSCLAVCPKCGGAARMRDYKKAGMEFNRYSVECQRCTFGTPILPFFDALKEWQTRCDAGSSNEESVCIRDMGFEAVCELVRDRNVAAGWDGSKTEPGTQLMLIVSEVAEAMEGLRRDLMDDHLPHRKMEEVELADAMIRIMDYAGWRGFDLAGAMSDKLHYNLHRADHKAEARAAEGGKKF